MIEKKRDVRVGLARFSECQRCGGMRRCGILSPQPRPGLGANARARAATIHGAGAASAGRWIARRDNACA
ncbi:MAG: hypothetical protein WAM74_09935, partial [Xanthobacteraceae bacterium]